MPHEIRFFFRTGIGNSRLADFLARCQAESSLPLRLTQQDREISLLARGDTEELAQLAEELGREIPLSIFLQASGVAVVSNQEESGEQGPVLNPVTRQTVLPPCALPPCPRCLREAEHNFQAGRVELVGGCRLCQPPPRHCRYLLFEPLTGQLKLGNETPATGFTPTPEEQNTVLAEVAARLAAGDCLQLDTAAGIVHLAIDPAVLPAGRNQPPVAGVAQITSLQAGPEYWHCGEDELRLLGALEKPLVLLTPTDQAAQKYQLPPHPVPVGLAADLLGWYLGRHLEARGIPLLFMTDEATVRHRPRVVADGARTWLSGGERALLPLQLGINFAPRRHGPVEHGQTAVILASRLPAATQASHHNHQTATGGRLATVAATPAATGQQWHAGRHQQDFLAFLATSPDLAQPTVNNDQQLFGLSLHLEAGGMALLGTADGRQSHLLLNNPAAAPLTCRQILTQIAALDPKAQRLLTNYARRHPRHWQYLQGRETTIRIDALGDLGPTLLQFCRPDHHFAPPTAADFLTLAAHPTPGRSPLLELTGDDDDNLLDHRRLLRSVLSYTLAGATPAALCRALLESLAERLARRIWEETPPEYQPRVALCTPLCLHPAFFQALRRQGGANFLLAPPPLPLECLPALGQLWPATTIDNPAQPLPDAPAVDQERRQWLKNAGRLFGRSRSEN